MLKEKRKDYEHLYDPTLLTPGDKEKMIDNIKDLKQVADEFDVRGYE